MVEMGGQSAYIDPPRDVDGSGRLIRTEVCLVNGEFGRCTHINITIPVSYLIEIDKRRGGVPRSTYIQHLIARELGWLNEDGTMKDFPDSINAIIPKEVQSPPESETVVSSPPSSPDTEVVSARKEYELFWVSQRRRRAELQKALRAARKAAAAPPNAAEPQSPGEVPPADPERS